MTTKYKKLKKTFAVLFFFFLSLTLITYVNAGSVFDTYTMTWTDTGDVDNTTCGVCYDSVNDTIWLGNHDTKTVYEVDKDTYIATGKEIDLTPDVAGKSPQSILYDPICDTIMCCYTEGSLHEVLNYTKDGVLQNKYTAPRRIDGFSFNDDYSFIYYVNKESRSVYKMKRDGTDISGTISLSGLSGSEYPDGLAVHNTDGVEDYFFVSINVREKISIFNMDGSYTGTYLTPSETGVEGLDFMSETILLHAKDDHHDDTVTNRLEVFTATNITTSFEFLSINDGVNGTTIYDNTPTINWSVVNDAEHYQLLIDNNADFSSPEVNITNINPYVFESECSVNSTRVSFTIPNDYALNKDYYYMKVRAYA